jgi:hypothetical protein
MAFSNQVNQLRNCSLVWVVHPITESLHAGRVGGTPSAPIQPTETLAQIIIVELGYLAEG